MITTIVLNPAIDKIYFVDNFEAGELYRIKDTFISAGGNGINVARVARALGENVSCVGFKAGRTGLWLEDQIRKLGVDTHFIEVEGESRTNNNIIDRARRRETELLEVGPYIPPEDLKKFMKLYEELLDETDVVVCSGGLPQGVATDLYGTMIGMAKSCNVRVLLDASGEILMRGMKTKPYMIKPNLRELNILFNKKLYDIGDIARACKDITYSGIEVVIASLGDRGAVMVTKDKSLWARVPQINEINPIGSGDSMVAGFASGLLSKCSLEEAFILASACGVNNAQHHGIGVVDRSEADLLVKSIQLERIPV